jgi:two-component system, cell cycle response regulator DivK
MLAHSPIAGAKKCNLLRHSQIFLRSRRHLNVQHAYEDSHKGNRMKILIVEDNSDMRDLIALRVQLTGYTPILASHGKEGVEKATAEKPDLILLDMMMPVMDGWEAARALRASRETKEIPILAVTALFRSEDLKSCLDSGCSGYIVKPFTGVDLQRKIRELLDPKELPA